MLGRDYAVLHAPQNVVKQLLSLAVPAGAPPHQALWFSESFVLLSVVVSTSLTSKV